MLLPNVFGDKFYIYGKNNKNDDYDIQAPGAVCGHRFKFI